MLNGKRNIVERNPVSIRAILFDLDGVLLKSMEQHLEAWQHAFRRFNTLIKDSEFYQLEGRGVKFVVETLAKKYKIDPAFIPEIMDEKVAYYNHKFHPEFYDGLYNVLDLLKSRLIKMAVVTGGYRDRVSKIINDYFKGYFYAIVTSDDVKNTKPYPEPYLKGASLLGVRPAHCLVIENAPMGIMSAKKAGMKVLAITTTLTKVHLQDADFIAKNFKEIQDYLKKNIL
jgi:HAD superfamily hydrolase (TIGR01509 family)